MNKTRFILESLITFFSKICEKKYWECYTMKEVRYNNSGLRVSLNMKVVKIVQFPITVQL